VSWVHLSLRRVSGRGRHSVRPEPVGESEEIASLSGFSLVEKREQNDSGV
jgi:hypothetical protein